MEDKKYKAYLRVKRCGTNEVVRSIGLSNLSDNHIERTILGIMINMRDDFFIDSNEAYAAQEAERKAAKA